MDLVAETYRFNQLFPKRENYGLASQIQRAAVSIPSNIAEGRAREHIKDYLHHFSMAQGSLAELETQLEIAARLNYISLDQLSLSPTAIASLGRQLYALGNSLIRIKPAPGPRHPAPAL
ncbi:MAG: four helix bundle protein [Acidobacteriota bacterium]|nr:four helix bundle protein [Acidobacteriota bacterium]